MDDLRSWFLVFTQYESAGFFIYSHHVDKLIFILIYLFLSCCILL